jgi:hypothetical protein
MKTVELSETQRGNIGKKKLMSLKTTCKNKNIKHLQRGKNKFKKSYQLRSNLVKYGNGDLFSKSHNILN